MAYVSEPTRKYIDNCPVDLLQFNSQDELAYLIIKLALRFSEQTGMGLQATVGVVESAKQEMFRAYLNPAAAQAAFDHGS